MFQRSPISFVLISALAVSAALAQAPAPARVVGGVTAADAAARTLTLKADDGAETRVKVQEGARVAQLAPGETTLQNAKPAELSAISAGDRVLARGAVADGVMQANLVVLMSKTDIAKKQQTEQAAWSTKGVAGIVTAVDRSANSVTVNSRGADGVKSITVSLAKNASVKRYAEGSTKYADAKQSGIADIEVNDQVRALGTKSDDGAAYTAEQLISGAFRNIAATVTSIDAANGTVEVMDLDTKKKIQVKIGPDANLRRMPEMMARMTAMMMNGGAAGGAGMPGGMPGAMGGQAPGGQAGSAPAGMSMRQPGAGATPAGGRQNANAPAASGATPGTPPSGGAGGPGAGGPGAGGMGRPGGMGQGMGAGGMAGGMGGMRRPGGDMGQMIDRMPVFQIAELKKDEPLILSISKTSDPAKAVAITILAGVEPILSTPANGSRAMMLGTWNLDGGGGMMGGGGMGTP